MSQPSEKEPEQRIVPPPPSEKRLAWMRLVFALLGAAAFVGVWTLTSALEPLWRVVIALLVAGPFLVIPDLLRDKSKPPAGFVPRKWDDEEDD